MQQRIRAFLSYLLSFRRPAGSWQFEDYPVCVRRQQPGGTGVDYPAYRAQIINWWTLPGLGDTPAAAKNYLRESFELYQQSEETLPRPGCRVPIQFAESSIVDADPEIYRKFIVDVLGFDLADPVFISDQSSLLDFEGVNGGIDLFKRTQEVFGVDVSDITDSNLASIFRRIQDTR